ncbi:MAG: hypothetical protein ACFB0G_01495 [Leptolyngbyaceae cyanobacterium]
MTPTERIAAAISWFRRHRSELPSTPFVVSQGVTVSDPQRYYAAINDACSDWDGTARRIWVCLILLPIRRLRTFLEVDHAPVGGFEA